MNNERGSDPFRYSDPFYSYNIIEESDSKLYNMYKIWRKKAVK